MLTAEKKRRRSRIFIFLNEYSESGKSKQSEIFILKSSKFIPIITFLIGINNNDSKELKIK